jgi:hypothetical protein
MSSSSLSRVVGKIKDNSKRKDKTSTRHQVVVLPADWSRKSDKTRRKTEHQQQEDKLFHWKIKVVDKKKESAKGGGQEER